jgi:hypothetical protein
MGCPVHGPEIYSHGADPFRTFATSFHLVGGYSALRGGLRHTGRCTGGFGASFGFSLHHGLIKLQTKMQRKCKWTKPLNA